MAIVHSGLGWDCEESFLNKQAGEMATINGRRYYKTNDIPAICGVHYNSSNYTMPFFISTVLEGVSFRADSGGPWTHNITVEYLGLTWYFNWGEHGFWNATPETDYPVLDTRSVGAYDSQAVALYILQQAGVVMKPQYFIQFVANGGYGNMPRQIAYCGEETVIRANSYLRSNYTFLGWDTDESSDTVVYQDGETVTDLTTEEETATLYAVWRQSMGWLFKDNAGHFYTAEQESGGQTRVPLDELHALSAEAFYTHGCMFPPDSDLMIDLDAPTIYKWDAFTPPVLTAKVDAVPVVPQLVVFATVTLLSAIKYVQIFGDIETPWNVSFDNGLSWYKYQGGWLRVSAAGDGTVKGKMEILTAADWAQMANNSIKFRCWLYAGGWTKGLRIDY